MCAHSGMTSRYGMTRFVASMNQVVPGQQAKLPPSDSRQRPDLRALEQGRAKEVLLLPTTCLHKRITCMFDVIQVWQSMVACKQDQALRCSCIDRC